MADLARQSGISESNIGRILSQQIRSIHDDTAGDLARALGVTYLDLLLIAEGRPPVAGGLEKIDTDIERRLIDLQRWLMENPQHIGGLEGLLKNYGFDTGSGE